MIRGRGPWRNLTSRERRRVLGRELTIYEQSLRTTALSLSYGFTDDPRRIEQKMDELTRKYTEARDPEIRKEIYRLARLLEELDH
jgi:hypothetical protein